MTYLEDALKRERDNALLGNRTLAQELTRLRKIIDDARAIGDVPADPACQECNGGGLVGEQGPEGTPQGVPCPCKSPVLSPGLWVDLDDLRLSYEVAVNGVLSDEDGPKFKALLYRYERVLRTFTPQVIGIPGPGSHGGEP